MGIVVFDKLPSRGLNYHRGDSCISRNILRFAKYCRFITERRFINSNHSQVDFHDHHQWDTLACRTGVNNNKSLNQRRCIPCAVCNSKETYVTESNISLFLFRSRIGPIQIATLFFSRCSCSSTFFISAFQKEYK